jgi:hypothetical protein
MTEGVAEASNASTVLEKCIKQSVLIAERNVKFPSNLVMILRAMHDQFTAEIATRITRNSKFA